MRPNVFPASQSCFTWFYTCIYKTRTHKHLHVHRLPFGVSSMHGVDIAKNGRLFQFQQVVKIMHRNCPVVKVGGPLLPGLYRAVDRVQPLVPQPWAGAHKHVLAPLQTTRKRSRKKHSAQRNINRKNKSTKHVLLWVWLVGSTVV